MVFGHYSNPVCEDVKFRRSSMLGVEGQDIRHNTRGVERFLYRFG